MGSATSKIVIKSPREIELMRAAGRLVYEILCEIEAYAGPDATTLELDEIAERRILAAGATALFKGVENPQACFPFPASICSSAHATGATIGAPVATLVAIFPSAIEIAYRRSSQLPTAASPAEIDGLPVT